MIKLHVSKWCLSADWPEPFLDRLVDVVVVVVVVVVIVVVFFLLYDSNYMSPKGVFPLTGQSHSWMAWLMWW